jgi:predicted nucleic acid-binding protein
MYLLDTNIVSELRKTRLSTAHPSIGDWFRSVDIAICYLSAITVQEIETGILLVETHDPAQAMAIRRWLEQKVLRDFNFRILPVDTAVARRCAYLHVPKTRAYRDALIAATAYVHNLPVVTRNVKDFVGTGVQIINPWDASHVMPLTLPSAGSTPPRDR